MQERMLSPVITLDIAEKDQPKKEDTKASFTQHLDDKAQTNTLTTQSHSPLATLSPSYNTLNNSKDDSKDVAKSCTSDAVIKHSIDKTVSVHSINRL